RLIRGPVAQLGARFHGMEEVKGSNPFRSTKSIRSEFKFLSFSFSHPTQFNPRNQVILALFQNQMCSLACWTNVFAQVQKIDFFPNAPGSLYRLCFTQFRVAMEIGRPVPEHR